MKIRTAVSLGAIPGTLLFFLLMIWGTVSLAQLAGNPDPDTVRVLDRYATKVYLCLARIGLVHLWIGCVLGAISGAALNVLFPRLLQRRVWFTLASGGVLLLFCGYLTARLLIRQPTFFDQFLHTHGNSTEKLQEFLTDRIGLTALDVTMGAVCLALLLSSRRLRGCLPTRLPLQREQLVFVLILLTIGTSAALRTLWSPPKPERPDRPNILILSVDSLRPDHLSSAGYHRPTTPNIDRLAAHSLVFKEAYVPLARTLSSWTSLLTSSDPHTHGVRHMFPDSGRRKVPLPSLPEVLAAHGYRSGVVSDFAGEMFHLIDFQFDLVDCPPASHVNVLVERQMLLHFPLVLPYVNHWLGKKVLPVMSYLTTNADARILARRALRRMRELADQGPFMMTVFFSTSHSPYASPYPYYRKFTDPDYRGKHKYAYGIRDPRDFHLGEPELSPEDKEQIVALYDGAIAHVDDAIGEMLEELRSWEFLDSTVILVTADHGEHLLEIDNSLDHGKWFRGGDHANHIPLILYDPSGELGKGPVNELVRSINLMPTLLGHLGIDIPPTCEGENLSPALKSKTPLPKLFMHAESGVWLKAPATFAKEPGMLCYPLINEILDADEHDDSLIVSPAYDELVVRAKHRMIRDDSYKLVYETTCDGAKYHLFDVKNDPGNRVDLFGQNPELTRRYQSLLQRWMRLDPVRRFDAGGHLIASFMDGSDGDP